MKTITFFRPLPDGSEYRLGTACERTSGWRFIPNVPSRRGSRKDHPTMEACLPRWVGYPDRCTSRQMPLAQAIENIRKELEREYDFEHGHKWTHEELVNAIMKTITNHLKPVARDLRNG